MRVHPVLLAGLSALATEALLWAAIALCSSSMMLHTRVLFYSHLPGFALLFALKPRLAQEHINLIAAAVNVLLLAGLWLWAFTPAGGRKRTPLA